jgi:glycosyltransferase involved in cell wall biosynthesis
MTNRIFIVTLMRAKGDTGVQTHVNSFFSYLSANGVPVERVTPYDRGMWVWYPLFALRYVIEWCHRPSGVLWYRYIRLHALKFRVRKLLSGKKSAVLYAQCPVSAEACLRARNGQFQRVVMVAHFNVSQADEWVGQGYFQPNDYVWHLIRKQEANVLPKLNAIVFVSAFMRDLVLQRIPAVDRVRSKVIANFVRKPEPRSSPAEHVLGNFALVSIGTLEPRKNQRYLLEIVAIARREIPGLSLTLIGDGSDRQILEQQVQKLGLASCVHLKGKVMGAADLLPEYDGYIHAAQIENLPISIIEAMAAGLPVFACPVGGIPEVFTDGREGHFLPIDNAQIAAQILSKALKSENHLKSLGQAALARFQTGFDQTIVAQSLLDFLLLDEIHEPDTRPK